MARKKSFSNGDSTSDTIRSIILNAFGAAAYIKFDPFLSVYLQFNSNGSALSVIVFFVLFLNSWRFFFVQFSSFSSLNSYYLALLEWKIDGAFTHEHIKIITLKFEQLHDVN